MVFGYCRISTDKQETDRQVSEILGYCEKHSLGGPMIIRETITGSKAHKPELEKMILGLDAGDMVCVWELSRLTRGGVAALFGIVERISKAGAKLIETKSGTVIDASVAGEAYTFALGLAARIEREMISERTRSALAAKKRQGVRLGRPRGKSKLDARKSDIDHWQAMGINKTNIARLLGVSRSAYLNGCNTKKLQN